jgi:glycerophosphoryl diester phosphodiesterase
MKWGMLLTLMCGLAQASGVIVIAHRGASGYLPEHTLEAKALAIGMGADYVEQDVVLTRDDVPIINHDITLEDVSDIAARFPGRARADGHFYAIDFTLAELKTLRRHERDNADHSMVFPGRFPATTPGSAIVTLSEEIEFVQGINRSTGRDIGLYTEVKYPAWHREQGKDITRIVLDSLRTHGYSKRSDKVFFQCFDAEELKRVHTQLKSELKLIQLIGENSWHESSADYEAMMSEQGIAAVARYADGIGPEITQLIEWPTPGGKMRIKPLGALAKAHGLLIHPYTLRIDSLPPNAPGTAAVLDALFKRVKIDGLFSDFPDVVVRYRNGHP